ncbi:hypothetical protein GH714_031080 [Hevea brasiliensis]|uniref:Small ribosomal subunit protein uS7 domain-containing protein n=1 Tax=Hevea brasiliensis TaxID=3981 RepID=A0A6A6M1Z4_HEVBR|nr:hypothetical protein GH714_031080 [Hevea brasiliensis]
MDISTLWRVNQAIYLLTTGAREAAFRNIKTIAKCLADELINAAKGSSNSYAIKKRMRLKELLRPTIEGSLQDGNGKSFCLSGFFSFNLKI